MSYKILFIDADHTLFDFDQSEEVAFKQLLKTMNRENEYIKLYPIYEKINRDIWAELHYGQITQDQIKVERFQRFVHETNLNEDAHQLSLLFTTYLSEASILYDNAYEVIEALSKKYRLVIVTNGLKEVQDKRVRNSILEPFIEATVISDEIGVSKPDPGIIDYAMKIINHSNKEDIVMVGDNLYSDIQCGFNAGIDTIWYNPNNKENLLSKEPTYIINKLNELLEIL